MRVGVVLPNWVGDVAMATPALRAMREAWPEARMVGIARPYLRSLLEGSPWLNEIVPWEHKGPGRLGRTWQAIRRLRAEKLDLLVSFRASFSAGLFARLSGAKKTLGYARKGAAWLLTNPIDWHTAHQQPISAVDDYLHLIGYLGLEINAANGTGLGLRPNPGTLGPNPATQFKKQLELATTAANEAAADGVWKRLALPPSERVMLMSAGGAFGEAKHWPAEYCVSLALRAADEFGLTTLVLCGPQEREGALAIETAANHPQVRSLAHEDVSFGTTKAIIRRSRLMVTTDSGPRHIASAFGTPTVVLFGPIDPVVSRNYQRETVELTVDLECRPCGSRSCPLVHHRCMRDLTVDRVLSGVADMLAKNAERKAA